jgi:predicted TIM-barrel fold metal-dependent hydrolase
VIVDTHPHILAADTQKYPIDPIGGVQSAWSIGLSFSPEELLEQMDHAGVGAATLVQASTVHGNDNSYVADSIAKYPKRFVGIGGIEPRDADAPQKMRYWVEERGMSGMRIFAGGSTVASSDWLEDAALDAFWRAADALHIPLNVQVRFPDTARVGTIAAKYPTLRLILDNLALMPVDDGPPYAAAQAAFLLARFPNVSLKLTNTNLAEAANPKSTPQALIAALIDAFGAERMMWGSNFPTARPSGSSAYAPFVDVAKNALRDCSADDRAWILGGTACELYPHLKEAS